MHGSNGIQAARYLINFSTISTCNNVGIISDPNLISTVWKSPMSFYADVGPQILARLT